MLFEKICNAIAIHVDVSPDEITMESCICNDLGADSLDMQEILLDLEDTFDLDLPDKQLGTIVGEYVRYIARKTETPQPLKTA